MKKLKLNDSDTEDDVDMKKAIEKQKKNRKVKETLMDDKSKEDDESAEDSAEETIKNDIKRFAYKKLATHYLADEVKKSDRDIALTSADYSPYNTILVIGFSNGAFYLYEMPDANMIHSLR